MKIEAKHRRLGKMTDAVLDLLELGDRIEDELFEIKRTLCNGYFDKEMEGLIAETLTMSIGELKAVEILKLCQKRVMGKKEAAR